MKTIPFLIQKDSRGRSLKPIDLSQPLYPETWLQKLLMDHPDILPVAEIEPVFYPLIPIGREVTVTLEIEAKIPGGVPDTVVRTVTENSRTLKFTSQGFEKE